MNIQIYGKKKCFTTKAAERFFKERRIKFQYINLEEKSMSPRELENILIKVKDIELLIDKKSPLYQTLNFHLLRTNEMKKKVLLENPKVFVTPIIRDCDSKECTVGDINAEKIWKSWVANNI